ncbi:MAG: hypothetical protein GY862_07865 [Gammaproteobacteria bacterium]|nr:hypothetical protein [Gammaproteobacteria bacterium]
MMTQNPTSSQKRQLAKLLFKCPTIQDKGNRESLLQELPVHIAGAIKSSDVPKRHVLNIVTACASHQDGITHLLDALRYFDGHTKQFNALIAFLERGRAGIPLAQPKFTGPLQRPSRPARFTGRKAELDKLLNDLRPGKTITLCGPGGIGKTALAAEAVWKLAPGNEPPERFPDGIVFYTFYGRPDADLALEKIAYAFGGEPRPSPFEAV